MTTEEAICALFPKKVVEQVKREIREQDAIIEKNPEKPLPSARRLSIKRKHT